jgi:hypothetical protein
MLLIGLWHEFSVYYVGWSFWQAVGIALSHQCVKRLAHWKLPACVGAVMGPALILAWLSAARPVIGLLGAAL